MAMLISELRPRPRLNQIKVSVDDETYTYLEETADANECALARAAAVAIRRGVEQMKAQEAALRAKQAGAAEQQRP